MKTTTIYELKPNTSFELIKSDPYSPTTSGVYLGTADSTSYGKVHWESIEYRKNAYDLLPIYTKVTIK